ncbi:unnamed protein product [Sphenostylis stenocarpa]|uniref:Uncharacterized protein n=1 Tax=Sphenostylis stenocarpa TaxID=92480 RepID=A0AA86W5I4_9FABA|nr:unnamed protein product [Sphenostylis stenocarpa]
MADSFVTHKETFSGFSVCMGDDSALADELLLSSMSASDDPCMKENMIHCLLKD